MSDMRESKMKNGDDRESVTDGETDENKCELARCCMLITFMYTV